MINYYYWFSCLSYCDDEKIGQKNCCNNILNKWDIIFHKEYSNEKSIVDLLVDISVGVINPGDIYHDFDFSGYMTDLIGETNKMFGKVIKKSKNVLEKIPVLAIPFIEQLVNFIYQYNFVILKNDNYKKIIVAFPGITYYFQIIEEIMHSGMVEIPIKYDNKYFNVLEMYYNIFTIIEKDLFENLVSLPEINDENYQVVFVGHSLGGAIATISSFYYIKKYNFNAENILITFGQPKVGSEVFAKELTRSLKQIYRIARPNDIGTHFPLKGIDYLFKYIKSFKLIIDVEVFAGQIISGNFIGALLTLLNYFGDMDDFVSEYSYLIRDRTIADIFYSHIGGLYMIDDDTNSVYQCDDFFNEKRDHFLCKNHHNKISLSFFSDFFHYRNYLSTYQNMMSSCQNKKLKIFRFSKALTGYSRLLRRLDIPNNNNQFYYNIQTKRKLDDFEDSQETLKLFEQVSFKKNNNEFCYRYKSEEILKINDLILIINPKNKHFFGEICFSQNITWLNNNEFDLMNCYFINFKNSFSLKIELAKEIIDEKELFIYIKGKISGYLELYDLTKNRTLNTSSSYIIPYINDFPSEKNINFILPKIEEDIYINIIINDYGLAENNTISSIFEIYKNHTKINFEKNYLMLEKDNEYYFKYYPNQYELILNFVHIYSNKFLEKQFYIINEQNISINYNIELKNTNKSFGLFFEFDGIINFNGYLSNIPKYSDNVENYTLNNSNNYIILKKNNQFDYFKLDININSGIISEFMIYEIQEVIIINKMNSIYEIKKKENYLFLINETIKKNFSKFESYIFISINNKNNIIKLLTLEGDIISSKNYLITQLINIKGIFIKVNEVDKFMIKIIPEEISKNMKEESSTFFGNTFIDNKKYSFEFIHDNEEIYIFFNSISNNLKIYELNHENNFQLEDFLNKIMNNYSLLSGLKIFEEGKTHIIFKESTGPFLYEKYINNIIIDFYYILDISKIFYLLMDFDYNFSYNRKIKKILLKVLKKDNEQSSIKIRCENELLIEIKDIMQIINLEKCNGTFIMSGNNSLIYFYLPLTLNDSYTIIEDEQKAGSIELNNINQFFFIPKKIDFNSINILLSIEYDSNDYPVYLTYYIEYGIIPF